MENMHANDEVWRVKWKCLYIHDWKYSRVDVVVIELKILLKCYKDSLDAYLGDYVAHSTNIVDFLICLHMTLNSKPNLWHRSNNSTWRWRWKNFHIKKGLAKIIMSIPEITASSHTSSSMEGSRITRLYSLHEVVLEYSVVIITLGCFLLISLSSRLLKGNSSCQCLPELCY